MEKRLIMEARKLLFIFLLLNALPIIALGRGPDEAIGNLKIWHSDSQYVWADSCCMADSSDTMDCDYFMDSM